jgi:hypothetical protein
MDAYIIGHPGGEFKTQYVTFLVKGFDIQCFDGIFFFRPRVYVNFFSGTMRSPVSLNHLYEMISRVRQDFIVRGCN